ncbi:hypothetical protein FA13DRAFT_1017804 [Coprinellus micaceus]|uniref:Uncharacterized protein n=1 Tax=Coprinellus micaceus TaxID=71717 RepID=A0A4Y7RP83_COPMI|nr:hypothetical protein FA13DRAFT_1017804 [Coprinellus micaceus]
MRGSARRHRPSTAFFWNPSNMTAHFVFIVQVLCAVVLPLASSFTGPPHTRTEPITSFPLNVQSPSTWSGQPPLEVMTISYRRQGVVPARLPCLIHSVYDCIASSLPPLHRTSQYHSPHPALWCCMFNPDRCGPLEIPRRFWINLSRSTRHFIPWVTVPPDRLCYIPRPQRTRLDCSLRAPRAVSPSYESTRRIPLSKAAE